jgi:hypothetical protein
MKSLEDGQRRPCGQGPIGAAEEIGQVVALGADSHVILFPSSITGFLSKE